MKQVEQQAHLLKLADKFFDNLIFEHSAEYGYVGLDAKRPFGNSWVEGDILKLIGIRQPKGGYTEDQERYARKLYCEELIPYLKKKWKEYRSTHTTGSTYLRNVSRIDK